MKQYLLAGAIVAMSAGMLLAEKSISTKMSEPEIRPFVTKKGKPQSEPTYRLSSSPRKAKAYDVPFIEDFSSSSTLNDWFIQDVNNDGSSWEYDANNQLLKCYFSSRGVANNDWVITPPINLGADDIYTLSFSYGSQGSRFTPEHLTVTMGKSEYGTQHTTVLFDNAEIQNFWNGSMETVTITLPVEEDGAYYFGFHCTSPYSAYCLYLDDVKVEQNGSHAAPEAVTDLRVTPGANGALTAEVSLVAPTTTADGKTINSNLEKINVYRDEELVHTFESPAPGAALSFTDSGITNGTHTYKAVAYLSGMEGAKAEYTAFIGVDIPMAVTNVKATENGNDIIVTWDAPMGVNGGYVGADVVTYTVTRITGETAQVLSSTLSDRSYTDNGNPSDSQSYIYYEVTAKTAQGSADAVESNALFFGPAYQIPFSESFAYCELKKSPWVMEYINPGWFETSWYLVPMGSNPLCPPIDGDDGMALFQATAGSMNLYEGNVIRLATPAINLQGTSDPFVSFYLFHYDTTVISSEYDYDKDEYVTTTSTYNDKLHLQVSVDNGEYVDIPDTEILLSANNKGWTKYTFPLAAYKNASKLSLGLVGTASGGGNICIDNLLITDKYDADIEITGLLGPQSVKLGQTAQYVCNIMNNGVSSTKDYTVSLYLDDEVIETLQGPGAAIFADGGEKTIRFSYTPREKDSGNTHRLYARVNYAADQCEANNTSEVINLEVPAIDLPRVLTLEGVKSGSTIELSWDEPQMTDVKLPNVDDMESYTPFAISNIGSYYLIDNDKSSTTYTISGIQDYDNAGGAMAWQVFNPSLTSLDIELNFNRKWIPRSGDQFLMSWGAAETATNDDWLISPLLSGEEQTISFYIKSVTLAYPERFRVLYSTDGRSMSDFVKVGDPNYYTPSSQWRKFSATLPAGAKYFAIQCISADAFGLMVDDISFIPANAQSMNYDFRGYNVYRDDEKLNSTPLAEPYYVDNIADGKVHAYTVRALYAQGESSPSAPWETKTTSITDAYSGKVIVNCIAGFVEIANYTGRADIFGLDGRLVATRNVDGGASIALSPGIYLVSCGDTKVKVLVK